MKTAVLALGLLFDYLVHTLITVGAFAILVGATWIIHEFAKRVEKAFYQRICTWLEGGLLIIGVVLLVAMTLYLTFFFAIDLGRTFRKHRAED
jgi:uncharacterized membrane protein HdeD (DUF308 family)